MKKKTAIILGVIVLLLIVFRLFLPKIVLHFVNKELAEMEEYTGEVEDIDIALIRGAYIIDGIIFLKEIRSIKTTLIVYHFLLVLK